MVKMAILSFRLLSSINEFQALNYKICSKTEPCELIHLCEVFLCAC